MNKYIISQNLKYWRKRKRVPQDALAEHLGIDVKTLRRYELGASDISALDLYKASEFLDISIKGMFEPSIGTIVKQEGNNVKRYRMFLGYTMMYAANELGICEDVLREYEHGKRRIPYSMLKKMAELYDTTVNELLK